MKTVITILSSIAFALPVLAQDPTMDIATDKPISIPANCYYVGAQSLTKGAITSGSAVASDKDLEASEGKIQLKLKTGKQDPDITTWTANQIIQLGHNYSLALSLRLRDGQRMGPRAFEGYNLATHAVLRYKNTPISGGSIRSNRIESQYSDGTGDQFYQANFELENVLLRQKLGAVDQMDADLLYVLRDSPKKMKLFSEIGDGNGVITQAHINCKISIDVLK